MFCTCLNRPQEVDNRSGTSVNPRPKRRYPSLNLFPLRNPSFNSNKLFPWQQQIFSSGCTGWIKVKEAMVKLKKIFKFKIYKRRKNKTKLEKTRLLHIENVFRSTGMVPRAFSPSMRYKLSNHRSPSSLFKTKREKRRRDASFQRRRRDGSKLTKHVTSFGAVPIGWSFWSITRFGECAYDVDIRSSTWQSFSLWHIDV